MLPAAVVAASLLGGCSFIHTHLGAKDPAYQNSAQQRPLEVPPDLDTPSSSGALAIPAAPAMAQTGGTTASAATAPPALDAGSLPVAPAVTAAPGVAIDGGDLRVADSVESTWARVGLALQRSGAATIIGRDEAGFAYTVETTGEAKSEAGWFKRAVTLGRAGKTSARVPLTVRVSADGTVSRVSIEGRADDASRNAARALLATLRQRLS